MRDDLARRLSLRWNRNYYIYESAFARITLQIQGATDPVGSFAHAEESEMSIQPRLKRMKSTTVISYRHTKPMVLRLDLHPDRLRVRVL